MSRSTTSMSDATRKFQKELNAGAVSLVLLSVFDEHRRAMYGYEIARQLESRAEGSLPMNQGALYPVLRSLEKQGLLNSSVKPSDSGPPRKYYKLTAEGRKALKKWREVWDRTTAFVDSVLENDHVHRTVRPGAEISRGTGTASEGPGRSHARGRSS